MRTKFKTIIAMTLILTCILGMPVFASESVVSTSNKNCSSSTGMFNFNIQSFVYYDNNSTSSVYIDRAFSRVTNNSSYTLVTDIRFYCYNPTGNYENLVFFQFPTPLGAGENSYGFRYYETTITKTGSTPSVIVEISAMTNWELGGGHVVYFPQTGTPFSL